MHDTSLSAQSHPPADPTALLDVQAVARMLGCSGRTIYRLADGGLMPRPRKISAMVRWSRSEIESWIAAGCPPSQRKASGR